MDNAYQSLMNRSGLSGGSTSFDSLLRGNAQRRRQQPVALQNPVQPPVARQQSPRLQTAKMPAPVKAEQPKTLTASGQTPLTVRPAPLPTNMQTPAPTALQTPIVRPGQTQLGMQTDQFNPVEPDRVASTALPPMTDNEAAEQMDDAEGMNNFMNQTAAGGINPNFGSQRRAYEGNKSFGTEVQPIISPNSLRRTMATSSMFGGSMAGVEPRQQFTEIGGGIGADGSMRNAVEVPVGDSYRGQRPDATLDFGGRNVAAYDGGQQGVLYVAPTQQNKDYVAQQRQQQAGISKRRQDALNKFLGG